MNAHDEHDETEAASADPLVSLLHTELRTVRRSALDKGADPEEVTADITGRVRRLRDLNAAGWPGPPADGGH